MFFLKIQSYREILPFFHSGKQNDLIASLTAKLTEFSDKSLIVEDVFRKAGYELANQIVAVQQHNLANEQMSSLSIVCTGSVFKSWRLLKDGFVSCLKIEANRLHAAKRLDLITIESDSTIGAAFLAAKLSKTEICSESRAQNSMIKKLDSIDLNGLK